MNQAKTANGNSRGKKWGKMLLPLMIACGLLFLNCEKTDSPDDSNQPASKKSSFLKPLPIGDGFEKPPMISHLQVLDLDNDGLLDVIVCDITQNKISWIRQSPLGVYSEESLAEDMSAPSHIQAVDFDKDGDLDFMVSLLGIIYPNNDKIGSIVILENTGDNRFKKHLIADKIARVADVRAADLDGDNDLDLAAIQFGYLDGETRWLENLGGWQFKSHILQSLSGGINVEVVDIDNDGDNDLITLVSQEWEEIYLFLNDGKGGFTPRRLFGSSNDDFGSSGIYLSDFDQDNDIDVLYTNGDSFDYVPPRPRPWQGVNWLENKGNLVFQFHRIADFGGAYNARPFDIDNDDDLDLFVVSSFNAWDNQDSQSFIWLENDGKMSFTRHNIASDPSHLLALELGDFNKDGKMDMVTGGLHVFAPFDRMARITLWQNNQVEK